MSYINSVSVGGSTYNLRDEEAIHDVSTLATKEELNGKLDSSALNNYMTTEQINNALQDKVSAGQLDNFATKEDLTAKADKNELNNYATKGELTNVNMSVEGTTLVLTVSSGGGNGGGGSNEVVMAEFPVSSITTNSEGHTVVALTGLTDLYNNEQARQNLQNSQFDLRWVDSNGSNQGGTGRFNLANAEVEEFPAGPGENEKMSINWTAGTLTFMNTGFPSQAVKVLLIHISDGNNGGSSGSGSGSSNGPELNNFKLINTNEVKVVDFNGHMPSAFEAQDRNGNHTFGYVFEWNVGDNINTTEQFSIVSTLADGMLTSNDHGQFTRVDTQEAHYWEYKGQDSSLLNEIRIFPQSEGVVRIQVQYRIG